MKKRLLLVLLPFLPFLALGQVDTDPVDAASTGMGLATVTVESHWAAFYNIANIAQSKTLTVGTSFKNRYQTEGFNTIAAVVVKPLGAGAITAGVNRFGDKTFNTQLLFIGYAYHLGGVNLGLKANYAQYSAAEYGSRGTLAVDFGVNTQLSKEFFLGASFFNINQAKLSDFQDERIASVLRIGLSYRPTEKVMVNAEAEKDLDFDPIARLGVAYNFIEHFTGRVGFAHDPAVVYGGIGVKYGIFQLDYAFNTHPTLPSSHTVSVSFSPLLLKPKASANEKTAD